LAGWNIGKGVGVMSAQIRILTVDDMPVYREGLGMIIATQPDMLHVAQASDSAEAIEEFRRHQPDVTLMERRLPSRSGIETMSTIRGEFPKAKIIMLASFDGDIEIQHALRAGALAYVLKSIEKKELLDIIRKVYSGRKCIPANIATKLAEHLGHENLTVRELDVLRLICNGLRNKQIAGDLGISETTVSFHIKNVVDKLQANDRTHAVTIALRRGLLHV
jgi:DNA-binding NarL/FixJ family response regulator